MKDYFLNLNWLILQKITTLFASNYVLDSILEYACVYSNKNVLTFLYKASSCNLCPNPFVISN
ncbi:hypothetical protein RCH18_002042 [Flavobacterium sp. PL11]|nr:hypothetical protein [Flavobacterium sp. PL11]